MQYCGFSFDVLRLETYLYYGAQTLGPTLVSLSNWRKILKQGMEIRLPRPRLKVIDSLMSVDYFDNSSQCASCCLKNSFLVFWAFSTPTFCQRLHKIDMHLLKSNVKVTLPSKQTVSPVKLGIISLVKVNANLCSFFFAHSSHFKTTYCQAQPQVITQFNLPTHPPTYQQVWWN